MAKVADVLPQSPRARPRDQSTLAWSAVERLHVPVILEHPIIPIIQRSLCSVSRRRRKHRWVTVQHTRRNAAPKCRHGMRCMTNSERDVSVVVNVFALSSSAHRQRTAMSDLPNRILGDKYRLVRPLNQGGMGSVWLAEHLSLAAPVAVKLIATEATRTAHRLQRFLREARTAAAARSPHVVQILDYGVDEGTPFIVMELLEGESLAERLLREGRLGARETEAIIRQVSRGLTRAHETGIVHRDLKPANIFISSNDEEEIVKLFDFGIAKATTEDVGAAFAANQTRIGSILGTPYYMSPEQLEGSRRCDHRTDIWAMGVIAYECLLGRPPFAGRGIGGLVLAICSLPAPAPSEHGPVPAGFDGWFARACARDISERFQSAREAAHELRRLIEPGFEPNLATGLAGGAGNAEGHTSFAQPADEESGARSATPRSRSSPALAPTTAATSSATIDRGKTQRPSRPLLLLVPIVGSITLAIAMQRSRPAPAVPEARAPMAGVSGAIQTPPPREATVAQAPPFVETLADELVDERRITGDTFAPLLAGSGTESAETTKRSDAPSPATLRSPSISEAELPTDEPSPPLERRETHSTRARGRGAAATRAARQAISPDRALLTITSTPNAAILLDGAPLGTTPLRNVTVTPGTHRVVFIRGDQRKTLVVVTAAGQRRRVSANFGSRPPKE
jgi:eukaryotic-like serine/threonine-protein kinase